MRRALRVAARLFALLVALELVLRGCVALTDAEHGLYRHDDATGWLTQRDLAKQFDVEKPPLHFLADTDAFGLRGRTPPRARVPGETRILVLGDSFTWGIGVESNQTFPAVMGAALSARGKPVTVINGGMPCYGTAQELAFYRAYAARFDPDVVVVAYYVNDDGDNLTHFVMADGYLWQDPVLFAGHPSFVVELVLRRSVLLAQRAGVLGSAPAGDGRARSLELLRELVAAVRADGRVPLVVQIPARDTTHFVLPNERATPYQALALDGEQVLELHALLDAAPTTPYLEEHHLDPKGHALVAEAVVRELSSRVPALGD